MSMFSSKPSIIIVSSSNTKPKSLIKLITHSPINDNSKDPNIVSHEWELNTKYYTANVNLFGITEEFVRTDDFNNSVEALIIHMDSNKESGLVDLDKWNCIESDCKLDVKLLVANYFTPETKITKSKAMEWCLKRGFELIELYPAKDNSPEESDCSDLLVEKIGVDRIVEALQTHVWPNLLMKTTSNKNNKSNDTKSDLNEGEKSISDILTNEGFDDFTELFSQLSMFKESLTTMSSSQRKQNAEELVTKFWQAIGGDEEELADV